MFVIFLAFASAYFYYSMEIKIYYKEQELKVMKTELAVIEKIIKEVKNLEEDKKTIEERIKIIQGLINNQSHLSRILGEFSSSIIDEVWVDNLSLSANQTFDFTANTFNNYLIAKYMLVLKDDPIFANIELSYVRKSKIKEEDGEVDIVNFKLSGIFIPDLISGWINSIALIGQSLPDSLEIGKSYNLSKETPLMPEYKPPDPIAALEKIRYIRSGGTINIISIERDKDTPWYFVRVSSDSLIKKVE
ncbi:hypothetical protein ES708_33193 [subsurface metagenome]